MQPNPVINDARLSPVAHFNTAAGNRLSLFTDYRAWVDQLLSDIAAAQSEICMEMYIFESEKEGAEVAEAMVAAAGRGVKVNLLYDSFGCMFVPGEFFAALSGAGIQVRAYNPLEPWKRVFRTNLPWRRRNHRKLVVIDGDVGHVGGMNLSRRFRQWQDVSLRIEGPEVKMLRRSHRMVWEGRYRKFIYRPWKARWPRPDVHVLDNFASEHFSPIKRHYLAAMKRAQKHILLAHGYFFPDKKLRKQMRKAARRGVEVAVVVPVKSDVAAVDYAARHIYGRLLRDGVKIYLFQRSMLHAKLAVVDDDWMTLGSANLDPISLFSNLEVNVTVRHRPLIEHTIGVIRGWQGESELLQRAAWLGRPRWEKWLDRVWYRLRRWFDKQT